MRGRRPPAPHGRERRPALGPLGWLGGFLFIAAGPRLLRGRISCPGCGTWVQLDTERCPSCGRAIASDRVLWSDPGRARSPAGDAAADPVFQALGAALLASAGALVLRPDLWAAAATVLLLDVLYTAARIVRIRRGSRDDDGKPGMRFDDYA